MHSNGFTVNGIASPAQRDRNNIELYQKSELLRDFLSSSGIQSKFAKALNIPGIKYLNQLKTAEDEAKENSRGINL